ncbi:unnamed protein product [Parajaminaea phylloscopi]
MLQSPQAASLANFASVSQNSSSIRSRLVQFLESKATRVARPLTSQGALGALGSTVDFATLLGSGEPSSGFTPVLSQSQQQGLLYSHPDQHDHGAVYSRDAIISAAREEPDVTRMTHDFSGHHLQTSSQPPETSSAMDRPRGGMSSDFFGFHNTASNIAASPGSSMQQLKPTPSAYNHGPPPSGHVPGAQQYSASGPFLGVAGSDSRSPMSPHFPMSGPSSSSSSASSRGSSLKRIAGDLEDTRSLRRPASFPVLSAQPSSHWQNPQTLASAAGGAGGGNSGGGGGGSSYATGVTASNESQQRRGPGYPPARSRVASAYTPGQGAGDALMPASGSSAYHPSPHLRGHRSHLSMSSAGDFQAIPGALGEAPHGNGLHATGFTFSVPHAQASSNGRSVNDASSDGIAFARRTAAYPAQGASGSGPAPGPAMGQPSSAPWEDSRSPRSAPVYDQLKKHSSTTALGPHKGASSSSLAYHSQHQNPPVHPGISSARSSFSQGYPPLSHSHTSPQAGVNHRLDQSAAPYAGAEQPHVPQLIRSTQLPAGTSTSSSHVSLSPFRGPLKLEPDRLQPEHTMSSHARHPSAGVNQPATVSFSTELSEFAYNWTQEDYNRGRKLIQFWRRQEDTKIFVMSEAIPPQRYVPGTITISCIWRPEKQEHCVTSVDTIFLLESIVNTRFSIEEKNRIRRNLEGFRPVTISKSRPESEEFFKTIMNFGAPKPRNIEKDVKIFSWKVLQDAIKKIVSKYSAVVEPGVPSDSLTEIVDSSFHQRSSSMGSSLHRSSAPSLMDESMAHSHYPGGHTLASSVSHPHLTSPAQALATLNFGTAEGSPVDFANDMSPQTFVPSNTLHHSSSFPGPNGSAMPRSSYAPPLPSIQQHHHAYQHPNSLHSQGGMDHGQMGPPLPAAGHNTLGESTSFLPLGHSSSQSQLLHSYQHHAGAEEGLHYQHPAHQNLHTQAYHGGGHLTAAPSALALVGSGSSPPGGGGGEYYMQQAASIGGANGFGPR